MSHVSWCMALVMSEHEHLDNEAGWANALEDASPVDRTIGRAEMPHRLMYFCIFNEQQFLWRRWAVWDIASKVGSHAMER